MTDIGKTIERLSLLRERLKLQKDILGYGSHIEDLSSAIALMKEQEAKERCLKTKCIICPHCDNCDVDENGLLKEHKSEYENGFNDAMLGKQELMYEGTDGKWHKKDW